MQFAGKHMQHIIRSRMTETCERVWFSANAAAVVANVVAVAVVV